MCLNRWVLHTAGIGLKTKAKKSYTTMLTEGNTAEHELACVASVIGEGEGERGRREKMRGIGERGEGTPATKTPFTSFLRSPANANF